jgi:hypothetical protein
VAAPDSLRVDIAAALGLGRAIVLMAGERVEAQPPELVERLLPDRFALWAILGFVRAPGGAVTVERSEDGSRVVWRTTDAGGRVTTFDTVEGRLAGITREQGGRTTSQLALTRDPATGDVTRARLTDFGRSARLEIEITGREPSEAFPPEIWRLQR